jgi:hypothetical protein
MGEKAAVSHLVADLCSALVSIAVLELERKFIRIAVPSIFASDITRGQLPFPEHGKVSFLTGTVSSRP